MNFFDAQDQARRATRWLVIVYVAATAAIVTGVTLIVGVALLGFSDDGSMLTPAELLSQNAGVLIATALITALFILGASLYKTAVLSSGGSRVAADMGGTPIPADVQEPLRRRLRNVVEEMAIASGVPVPEIYVLEEESGINAFAAGYSPGDAAIAVTRGALELLDRNELQGVIAHEFSHILNGDMRLNIRLMGVLFGIMVLGLIGRMITRGGYHTSLLSGRRNRGAPAVMIIGLGLALLGGIGVLFARIIKAAVSRQREYLADASAVQFTRQSEGIANALKKIGGFSGSSFIRSTDPEEVSHMLFGSGAKLFGLFATHPPLTERIQALDPTFRESDYPSVDIHARRRVDEQEETAAAAGFTSGAAIAGGSRLSADAIAESVGRPETPHVAFARGLRASIPDTLYAAAHSVELSYLLTISLVLDQNGRSLDRQMQIVTEQLGADRANMVRKYQLELTRIGPRYRLPLLDIAFPVLKARPAPQLGYLMELANRLIHVDDTVDLYEFCVYRILRSHLEDAVNPAGGHGTRKSGRRSVREATLDLLTVLAEYGHDTDERREQAFLAGRARLGRWAQGREFVHDRKYTVAMLDQSLDVLRSLNIAGRRVLLEMVGTAATQDGLISVAESELIRAICAALDCPLPPILDQSPSAVLCQESPP